MKIENKKARVGLIITVSIIGLIVLFVVTRKVKSFVVAFKDQQDNKSEKQVLKLQGHKLSFPLQWYEAQARKIYNSSNWTWYDWNCDETNTMNALQELKNDLDYLELVAQFGIRDGYDIHGFIDGCLNQEEKDQVNNVWAGKGIKKRL